MPHYMGYACLAGLYAARIQLHDNVCRCHYPHYHSFAHGLQKMQRIPHGLQNFVEWVFEILYNFVEGLTGRKIAKKYFWYFATVFIFILVSNYLGLLPGVGSVTYDGQPLLRGANADFNVTIFLGFSYAILWFIWVMKEQGPWHFLTHTFGPKGGLTGFLKYALLPIFFFVGLIEILSICVRPVALAARLFGNIFAGESILEQMGAIGWFAMLPFMFPGGYRGLCAGISVPDAHRHFPQNPNRG